MDRHRFREEARAVSATVAQQTLGPRIAPIFATGAARVVERNFLVYRRSWMVFLTGLLEPVFYLLSIGVGVSDLVGKFTLSDGSHVGYVEFVAPAMLAASAMNGAIFDATYNIFFRLKYEKLYDAMLATPMRPADIARGEVTWALLRGAIYSAAFIVVMVALGLVHSWWMLLALPGTLLIGYAFAGAGMALTTWMRSWQDFEYIQLAILPMFLFSGTFYPLSTYPGWLRHIVEWTPLYQGVLLMRSLSLGDVGADCLGAAVYFAVIGTAGMWVAGRRITDLLLK
jgi:lipooligosaccharide transport system permease protein